jgi:hypothetical protein
MFLLLLTNCNAYMSKNNKEPSNHKIPFKKFQLDNQSTKFTISRNPVIPQTQKIIKGAKLGENIKLNCDVRACDNIYYVSWSHRPLFSHKRKRLGKIYYNDVHKKRFSKRQIFSTNYEIEWEKDRKWVNLIITKFQESVQGHYYCKVKTFKANKMICDAYQKIKVLVRGKKL